MQSSIGDQLARMLLAGEVRDGSHVHVDVDEAGTGLTLRATDDAP